ncbi:MAG TPA: TonB family protein [Thermoanaerobaculia bacterium]|nr:TonB family protein [Thermoanaerobaculia bacterium]
MLRLSIRLLLGFLLIEACTAENHEPAGKISSGAAVSATPASCPESKIAYIGGADKAPVLLHRVEPNIPASVLRNIPPGVVIIEAIIDRSGRVCSAKVLRPLHREFDSAAIAAVRQWHFRPAELKGEPVQAAFNLSVLARAR